MDRLARIDMYQPPLCPEQTAAMMCFEEWSSHEIVQAKSPIVIYLLERYLGKNTLQRVCHERIFP
jgi:hypothetical protein